MSQIKYSIIIPVHNEKECLKELYRKLTDVLKNVDNDYEIIFINDGSTDNSLEILNELNQENEKIKIIDFSRNFGHQMALTAGLKYASGEAIITMDADLQDPPEIIPQMIEKWKQDYKVVYGLRKERQGESIFKKMTALGFYRLINKLSQTNIPVNAGDFRLIDRQVVESLKSIKEQHRFLRGLISWTGFKQTGVEFIRPARFAGTTHYPFKKMLKFALDAIYSFSTLPLKLCIYLGFLTTLISIGCGIWALIMHFFFESTVQGWTSLIIIVLFLGGIQLITLGIIGEYVGRTYEESKKRPLYLIKTKIGFKNKD